MVGSIDFGPVASRLSISRLHESYLPFEILHTFLSFLYMPLLPGRIHPRRLNLAQHRERLYPDQLLRDLRHD